MMPRFIYFRYFGLFYRDTRACIVNISIFNNCFRQVQSFQTQVTIGLRVGDSEISLSFFSLQLFVSNTDRTDPLHSATIPHYSNPGLKRLRFMVIYLL